MTITEKEIKINNIPAIILGNPSRNVYLYIHGQGGNKEEQPIGREIKPIQGIAKNYKNLALLNESF